MRIRLSDTRCQKDLHTADARYHEDCRKSFMRGIQLGRSISEKVLKEHWDQKMTLQQNLKDLGLAYNANSSIAKLKQRTKQPTWFGALVHSETVVDTHEKKY